MSKRQEFHAATVEEAIDKACKALNVARDHVRVEVLDQGSSGFLGMGARDARITVEYTDARADAPAPEMAEAQLEPPAEERAMQPGGEAPREVARPSEDYSPTVAEVSDDLIIAVDQFTISLIEAMQGMAHRTARRALREKRPLSLPPMSPAERRVIHLFLKENPDVTTTSEGEEENRRVVVNPI